MFRKSATGLFALLALVTLMGAECTFVGTSGGNRDQEDGDRAGLIVVVRDGRLVDGPVQGVGYISGGQSGVTGFDGEFRYEEGKSVRFFIGDLMLGEAAAGKAVITPLDLVPGGTLDSTAVINIARLLQSLDSVPGDDRITIPATLQRAAAAGSAQVGAAIRDLDFADPTAFTNAASQLVASLTASYPFTASLVDAQTAREHLRAAIAASP